MIASVTTAKDRRMFDPAFVRLFMCLSVAAGRGREGGPLGGTLQGAAFEGRKVGILAFAGTETSSGRSVDEGTFMRRLRLQFVFLLVCTFCSDFIGLRS